MGERKSKITDHIGKMPSMQILEDNTNICRKKRLLFITNIPSPYRVAFFNE